MQFSHLASSCSQGALALLQGAFFALWKKRSSSKRNIIPPTCLWTDLFVCFSPFECQPREMPRTCILLKPGVSPNSPSPTVPIPQPVLPGATAEPAGTSLPKDGLVWNSFPSILCTALLLFLIRALRLLASQLFFFFFLFSTNTTIVVWSGKIPLSPQGALPGSKGSECIFSTGSASQNSQIPPSLFCAHEHFPFHIFKQSLKSPPGAQRCD